MSPIAALRAHYFFSYGALGALFPFLPLLLADRGLSPAQISWVMVLLPATALVMPPVWGSLADAFSARVQLLRVASLACAASTLLLLPAWGLWGNLLATGVLCLFRAPLASLADAATYAALGGRGEAFARVRVWGSVGFAVFVQLLGSAGASTHPWLLVGLTSVIYLLAGLSTLPLPGRPTARQRGVLGQAPALLARPGFLVFLAANTCYYVGHSAYDAFFSLHARALGFDAPFIGTAWSVGVVVEIGVMLAAPALLVRVRAVHLLALCAAVAVARWSLLSVVTGAAPLLAIQTLHGVTFGLWYLAMVRFNQARAPERLRTSFQAVTLSTMGLGMVLGYLGGGVAMERLGGAGLYQLAAGAALGALALYGLAGALLPPPSRTRRL